MFPWRVDVNCQHIASQTSLICHQPELLREEFSNLDQVQFHGLKSIKKCGRMGGSCWALSLGMYLSQGLCHHHWLWIPFVPVLRYEKSTRVCQQDSFYALEMRGREQDRERSFILSMPLHQHSDHIAFISDPATLLCLYSSFFFWFIYFHCWKQNFLICIDSHLSSFRKCYTVTVALARNSLLPPVRRKNAGLWNKLAFLR